MTHRLQLGLCIPDDKVAAIRCGDLSGRIVHPVLVHVAQLWGNLLCWQNKQSPACLTLEGVHLSASLELLSDRASLSVDPVTSIRAHCLLSLYFFTKLEVHRGRTHLTEAGDVALRYNLHIVQPSAPTSNMCAYPASFQYDDETTSALCQFLYLDKCCVLLLDFPSTVKGDLDPEVHLLQV
jgi:hypothetical protein